MPHWLGAGTPLPIEEDRQEGEVDGDDVAVEEPKPGCQLHTDVLLMPFTRKPLLGIRMGHTLLSTGGPLIDESLVGKVAPQPASRHFWPIRGDFRFRPL